MRKLRTERAQVFGRDGLAGPPPRPGRTPKYSSLTRRTAHVGRDRRTRAEIGYGTGSPTLDIAATEERTRDLHWRG